VTITSSASMPPARPKVPVVWVMTTPGYFFKSGDGVKFKNGESQFDVGSALNSGHEYQRVDRMTEKGIVYNYTIQVSHPDGRTKCVYDPGIVNDWATDP
jgi:hypothetical protein